MKKRFLILTVLSLVIIPETFSQGLELCDYYLSQSFKGKAKRESKTITFTNEGIMDMPIDFFSAEKTVYLEIEQQKELLYALRKSKALGEKLKGRNLEVLATLAYIKCRGSFRDKKGDLYFDGDYQLDIMFGIQKEENGIEEVYIPVHCPAMVDDNNKRKGVEYHAISLESGVDKLISCIENNLISQGVDIKELEDKSVINGSMTTYYNAMQKIGSELKSVGFKITIKANGEAAFSIDAGPSQNKLFMSPSEKEAFTNKLSAAWDTYTKGNTEKKVVNQSFGKISCSGEFTYNNRRYEAYLDEERPSICLVSIEVRGIKNKDGSVWNFIKISPTMAVRTAIGFQQNVLLVDKSLLYLLQTPFDEIINQ